MSGRLKISFREVGVVATVAVVASTVGVPMLLTPANSQRAHSMANAHRLSAAILGYAADNETAFPCATTPDLSRPDETRYRPDDQAVQDPAGWFLGHRRSAEDRLVWNNVITPYLKPGSWQDDNSQRIYLATAPWPNAYSHPASPPRGLNLTYNGLLQYLTAAEVDDPKYVPLLWQGQGDITRVGAAMANPRLNCSGIGPCRFNPVGMPQSAAIGNASILNEMLESANYAPTGRNVHIFADGSARAIYYGRGNQLPYPASTNSLTPFEFINDDGTLSQSAVRTCFVDDSRQTSYVAAFMPSRARGCR